MKVGRLEQWGAFSTTWGTVVAMETNQRDGTRDQRPPRDFLLCWSWRINCCRTREHSQPSQLEKQQSLASASEAGTRATVEGKALCPLIIILIAVNILYTKLVVQNSDKRYKPGTHPKENSAHPY